MTKLIASAMLALALLAANANFNHANAASNGYEETGSAIVKVVRVGTGIYRVYKVVHSGAKLIAQIEKASENNDNIVDIVFETTGAVVEGVYDDVTDIVGAGSILVENVAVPMVKVGFDITVDYAIPGAIKVVGAAKDLTVDHVLPTVGKVAKFGVATMKKGLSWLTN